MDSRNILSDLKNHLIGNYKNQIQEVILFGSHAFGNPDAYSDYDVLIVLENEYSAKGEDQILDLCCDIDLKYNILLDVHLLSKNELNSQRGRQPFFVNAINNGIYA